MLLTVETVVVSLNNPQTEEIILKIYLQDLHNVFVQRKYFRLCFKGSSLDQRQDAVSMTTSIHPTEEPLT